MSVLCILLYNLLLTSIRALILNLKLPTTICTDGFWDITDGTAQVACLLVMILIHLTPYCVRTFMV